MSTDPWNTYYNGHLSPIKPYVQKYERITDLKERYNFPTDREGSAESVTIARLETELERTRNDHLNAINKLNEKHHDETNRLQEIIQSVSRRLDNLISYCTKNDLAKKMWSPGKLKHIIKVAGEKSGRKVCNCQVTKDTTN